jgi:hypothetical protein
MKQFFVREKRPGELVFAMLFAVFSFFLLSQIENQTVWKSGMQLFSQPSFWPRASLYSMAIFSCLLLLSSTLSPRIDGRWEEVFRWISSLEYVAWFLAYVVLVPILGYLFCSLLFPVLLTYRVGHRSWKWALIAATSGLMVVLVFKTGLGTKIPGGAVYEFLPDSARSFMLTYF